MSAAERSPTPEELAGLLRVLERAAARDAELRAALAGLGAWLAGLVARAAPAEPAVSEVARPAHPASVLPLRLGDKTVEIEVHDEPERVREVRRTLDERRRVESEGERRAPAPFAPPDLGLIARRARLKAEACRWAIERRRRLEEGQDYGQAVKPRDQELISRAKDLPDCYLWPLSRHEERLDDLRLELLAGCYEALAAAGELCALVRADAEDEGLSLQDAYQLLAEAQSALRVGIEASGQRRERDQDDAFHWLRQRTDEDGVYVHRFMRLQDPADPEGSHDLIERIGRERERVEQERQKRNRALHALSRLRYHAGRAQRAGAPEEAREDWETIALTVEELVELGLRPSDVRLRELLLPLQDALPDWLEPGPGFALVLAEIDRHLALQEAEEEPRPARAELTPEVLRVRESLHGKCAVLIGGRERPRSREALEQAFGLSQLTWISTEPHTSLEAFEPDIARPQTQLVLLAIRWSSHAYEGVKHLCKKHGKVFVRLPRGYGQNQVAHAILEQASRQLA